MFLPSAVTTCNDMVQNIPDDLLAQVQSALTGGPYSYGGFGCPSGDPVGSEHDNAVGYVTVDVARTCTTSLPTSPTYWSTEIAFDNVLIGDYQRISPSAINGNFAGGNPMVHIRAVPEGGLPGDTIAGGLYTNLPFTFYDRYIGGDTGADRRQPLPGLWAARYIEQEEGVQDFATDYVIWLEGEDNATCANISDNDSIGAQEIVRFDEHENPFSVTPEDCLISPCPEGTPFGPQFRESGRYPVTDSTRFPPDPTLSDDLGGWMYLNLNRPLLGGPHRRHEWCRHRLVRPLGGSGLGDHRDDC